MARSAFRQFPSHWVALVLTCGHSSPCKNTEDSARPQCRHDSALEVAIAASNRAVCTPANPTWGLGVSAKQSSL